MKRHAEKVRRALAHSHRLALQLDEPEFPLRELEALQDWQRHRLAETYADLIANRRYSAAGTFFLDELYGGLHFRERDQEVERVLPIMIRMLRDDMLLAMAESFDLQSLSLELDMDMTYALQDTGWEDIDAERYGALYRTCGRQPDRERQIGLIHRLGLELNELVHHRLVLILIRMVRGPARAAGFGKLQTFLEEGLHAFRTMGDGTEFIETIARRERAVMQRLFEAHAAPFDLESDQNVQSKCSLR